jgi:hypothetical protein
MGGRMNALKWTRCPCCGSWGSTVKWDFRRFIYCSECEGRGHVPGKSPRNSCGFCKENGPTARHWDDTPSGLLSADYDADYVRKMIAVHKRGCRFCEVPNSEDPLSRRYDSTLGELYLCAKHTGHTIPYEEHIATQRKKREQKHARRAADQAEYRRKRKQHGQVTQEGPTLFDALEG